MFTDSPLAYHITFGTYAARLHGDPRRTVDRRRNDYGQPYIGRNDGWRKSESERTRYPPIGLSEAQRRFVESIMPDICHRGGWEYRIAACQVDHVHVLLSTHRDAPTVRKWLKRWLGEELTRRFETATDRPWWAEGGSVKWIWKRDYLQRAYEYIERQRASTTSSPDVE